MTNNDLLITNNDLLITNNEATSFWHNWMQFILFQIIYQASGSANVETSANNISLGHKKVC